MSSKDDASSLLTHSERYKNLLLQVSHFLSLGFHVVWQYIIWCLNDYLVS